MGRKRKKQRKQRKHSFLMIFACLMIFAGTLILLYPIVGNYLANRERSEAVSQYDDSLKKMSQEERDAQIELAKKYNDYIYKKQQGQATESIVYSSVATDGAVMGTLDIPALDISALPFYNGTSYQTLDKGLGHFEPSSIPVGGLNTRSVITGHSGVKNQVLFTDIKNLVEGDIFFVNILGKRLAYEIDAFEEVLPSEIDKVKVISGKDTVTLLTCTPPGINTYRLLVTGHRIPYEEALNKKVAKRNLWSYQTVVLLTLGANLLLFLILMGIYRFQVKRFRSDNKKVVEKARKQLKRLFFVSKCLFITLFIAMVTILGIAIYGYAHMQEETEMPPINIGMEEEISEFNLDKISQANFEEKQIASVNVSNYAEAKTVFQQTANNWGIGKLVIPKVSIDLPILAGLANENLLTGAATYRKEQQLGKGNYVLLAHNIFERDVLLHRIRNLAEGDTVYTTDFKDVYTYKVTVNKVIRDTEVEYVEKQPTDTTAILTLLRCEGDIGTIYRRVVQGELSSIQPLKTADAEVLKELGLLQQDKKVTGELIKKNPVDSFQKSSMLLSARVISEPMQTIVPLFLLFLMPILFLNFIR
ncbi:class A sortase [Enterococcus sp. JM4C]|uniref:sortase family protein n=1 Tax=Candidatus Enterococcus huntleyi TaxID=1857217 RepID=UPI00137A9508|nr:class C sortase [Enterococcus sp. JM4C]KAF1295613.1 class A sortase [Enterococcus sp. JM4C]